MWKKIKQKFKERKERKERIKEQLKFLGRRKFFCSDLYRRPGSLRRDSELDILKNMFEGISDVGISVLAHMARKFSSEDKDFVNVCMNEIKRRKKVEKEKDIVNHK